MGERITHAQMPTLMFSDIQGSTAILQRVGPLYAELLGRHRVLMRSVITEFGGHERGTEGDSFFVTFQSAAAAVAAAVELQRTHRREPWPHDAAIRVRVGIHTGEASETPAGLVGLAIHHAARIASAAHGGQIVVSGSACDVMGPPPPPIALTSLGVQRLRDVGDVALFQVTHPDIGADFPPLRTKGSARNNLPAPLSSLVGRTVELRAIGDLLQQHRLVTLTGAGGSGKTRLALHAASQAGVHYADGVWFVDLAALSMGDQVMVAVGEAVGARGGDAAVIDAMRGHTMLLVFDNCEHVLDACGSVITRLLAVSSTSAVLATSREPIGVAGEAVFRVPSLSLPPFGSSVDALLQSDAGRLFVDRAALVRPGFAPTVQDADAICEICERLDGIPLAIELAAARVRMLTPGEIARRLDDRFRLLTGGSRSVMPRQQTLRATVDWSFRLLTFREQTMLTRLAVFQGGCDLHSAEVVCADHDMDALDVLDVVSGLQDKSLVMALDIAPPRYRLTETIRQYATDRLLETSDVEVLRDRHAHHFARRTCAAIASSAPHALSDLAHLCDTDGDNLRMAATWLLDCDPAAALELLCDLNIAATFWHGMSWIATMTPVALQRAPDAPHDLRAVAHVDVAGAASFGYVDADPYAHRAAAEALVDSMSDRARFAYVTSMLAFQSSSMTHSGIDLASVGIALAAVDDGGSAVMRFAVRTILLLTAPFVVAEDMITTQIALAAELDEPLHEQRWSIEMGIHMGFAGRSAEALNTLRGALLDLDHLSSNGDAFQSALFAALLEGEHGDLSTGLNLAVDLAERLDVRPHDQIEEAIAASAVAWLHAMARDFDAAERAARRADELLDHDQPPSFLGGLVGVTLSTCLRHRHELGEAAHVLWSYLNRISAGSTDIWFRQMEEAALLCDEMGRRQDAVDLMVTASLGRLERNLPMAPAAALQLGRLRAALGTTPGTALDTDGAARLIESLTA